MYLALIMALTVASCVRSGAVVAFHPRASAPAPCSALPLKSTRTLQLPQQAPVRDIARAHSVAAPWQRHPASFAIATLTAASAFVTLFPLGGLAIGASAALVFTAQANASEKPTSPQRAPSPMMCGERFSTTRAPFWKRRPASFALVALTAASAVTTCFPLVGLGGASLALIVAHRG